MPKSTHYTSIAVFILLVGLAGCERPAEEPTQRDEQPGEQQETREQQETGESQQTDEDERLATAKQADQALRQRLMGRVMEVAQEEDFAAAVEVCHEEAIPLTEEVGDEFDVRIGRVSDRLRNQDNQPEPWVEEMIDEAGDEAYHTSGEPFRRVTPIQIAEPCLNCHGTSDQLASGVPELLAEHYPDDQATGYEVGDLRGWVWVEVP